MLAPDAIVCRCLSVERQVLLACIAQGAHTTAALQEATGCGTGCGTGCLRQIIPMLQGRDSAPPRPATPKLGPPQPSGGFLGWLRGALSG